MPIEEYIDFDRFKLGLYALDDTTKAPFGSARLMKNMRITNRGGIAPRQGTEIIGTENTNGNGCRGLYNFRRSFGTDELLLKAYDDELEVISKNQESAGWFRIKNSFTVDSEFGFVTSLVNEDNADYCAFCNRYEAYQGWTGAVTLLDGALAGGETSVQVDSVLTSEIFESLTASSATATTIDVSNSPWASSQWINLYVYIKTGTHANKIRKITANTSTQITFDTLGTSPGTADFEIRQAAFPASGTIIYSGTTIAYSAIPEHNKFTVSSAHAASDNTPVTLSPTAYPENPRGNRFTNYLGRTIVGNVRSALARDTGGSLQGFSSAGSYFVSNISDPFDFTFSASRASGEGDIVSTPYGGGDITDVAHQEDTAYVFKQRYIESVKYSQDANDLAVREPLKAEVGSVGQVIKGADDVYFFTTDNRITSIGRVLSKDIKPQTEDIGFPITRLLETYVFGQGKGKEHENRIYFPAKSSSSVSNNDIVIVYNKITSSFEGIWDIPAYALEEWNGDLCYAESNGSNVYKMLTGKADVVGTTRFPISAKYATHFMNLSPTKGNEQSVHGLYFEGYIKGATQITFKAWKDFSSSPFIMFSFGGDETTLLDGSELSASLGSESIGLQPLGSISDPDSEGRRHFKFRVYFPYQYGTYFSFGWESAGADFDYEITRFGMSLKEAIPKTSKIKSI